MKLEVKAGDHHGLLTVVLPRAERARFAVVRCQCGTQKEVLRTDLQKLKSCGCARRRFISEGHKSHGHCPRNGKSSPTYKSWQAMKARCQNPARADYYLYGGRGVTVCKEWLIFENFLADMGERPPNTTLERKDVNGNYEPGNCKWATVEEQASNKRNSIRLEHEGQLLTPKEAGGQVGISATSLLKRLKTKPLSEALTAPPHKRLSAETARNIRSMFGEGVSRKEIAAHFHLDRSTVSRIVTGKTWTNP